jgi:hypothetical protein
MPGVLEEQKKCAWQSRVNKRESNGKLDPCGPPKDFGFYLTEESIATIRF